MPLRYNSQALNPRRSNVKFVKKDNQAKNASLNIFGRWLCNRCQANNRRGIQCGKAAIKGKSVCRNHGGKSTGPKSQGGKDQIGAAHLIHGRRSSAVLRRASLEVSLLRQLEDALRLLNAAQGPRLAGRKPLAYKPISNEQQLKALIENLVKFGRTS